jgi:CBS domain-containing protein
LYTRAPGDDVRAALETMRSRKVRRLPVVGHDGKLAGILSLHDIALQARSSRNQDLMPEAVLETFVAITAPSTPVLA